MTSEVVAFRSSRSSVGLWLSGVIALGLISWALFMHYKHASGAINVGLLAVVPGVIFVQRLTSRRERISGVLDDTGIVVESPPQTIPYANLRALLVPWKYAMDSRSTRFPLTIVHASGTLTLPERMNVASIELYRLLERRFPASSAEPLPADLAAFHDEQVGTFGHERVWSCRGRSILGTRPATKGSKVWGGVACIGIAWIALAAVSQADTAWLGWGFIWAFFGGLIWLTFYASRGKPGYAQRRGSNEAIVISPIGLAMRQGELLGQLSWHDITAVKFGYSESFWLTTNRNFGIRLEVAGGRFTILDCYDQPLSHIYQRIIANWRPPSPPSA